MTALVQILRLWRRHYAYLAAGAAFALIALLAGLGLMAAAGQRVSAALLVAGVGPVLLLRVLGPIRVVGRYAERLLTHGATFRALADLRVWFFRRLAANSAGGLGMRDSGDMLSRLVNDIDRLDGLYLRLLLPLLCAALVMPAIAYFGARANLWAGEFIFLLLGATALCCLVAGYATARIEGKKHSYNQAILRTAVLDLMRGLREITAYAAQAIFVRRIENAQAVILSNQRKIARLGAVLNFAAFLALQAAMLLVLATHAPLPVKITAIFIAAAGGETWVALARTGLALGQTASAAGRVTDIANSAPAIEAVPSPTPLPPGRRLSFAAVNFAWAPDRPAILRGLSLDIPAGAKIAILGPSGGGKSTIAALALAIAAPQAGRVCLGGVDIAQLAPADLHANIAWLGQTSHLFADTIRANLLLGRPGADDGELWSALDRAGIGEWARTLPDGLDNFVGEGGAKLSRGQGRRVALARVLLSSAPILILDEPCAGLDSQTEHAFLQNFYAQIEPQRTVILIGHRLTGAEKLDRIYRLSEGRVVAAAA